MEGILQLYSFSSVLRDLAFVVCCFLIAAYRPQRIQSPGLFKLGCFLWAMSIVAPFILAFGMGAIGFGPYSGRGSGGGSFLILSQLAAPAFYGGAFVCTMIAIVGNGYFPDPDD
jgi:hypothetical protein